MEGVGGERAAYGQIKFSNPRTSQDKLQLDLPYIIISYIHNLTPKSGILFTDICVG